MYSDIQSCGRAKLCRKCSPEDLNPWVDKLVVLSLTDGESTTAHVLSVDLRGRALIVDVLSSSRPYPDSEHRAYAIPLGRILSVFPGPAGLSPRRALPSPDPCYPGYGAFDRLFLFAPIILLIVPGSVILFIFLGDLAYGIQFASLIIYTAAVVLITFSAQSGQQRYLFTCPVVKSQIPCLARRHVGFLVALFVFETIAFYLRPHLPAS